MSRHCEVHNVKFIPLCVQITPWRGSSNAASLAWRNWLPVTNKHTLATNWLSSVLFTGPLVISGQHNVSHSLAPGYHYRFQCFVSDAHIIREEQSLEFISTASYKYASSQCAFKGKKKPGPVKLLSAFAHWFHFLQNMLRKCSINLILIVLYTRQWKGTDWIQFRDTILIRYFHMLIGLHNLSLCLVWKYLALRRRLKRIEDGNLHKTSSSEH